MLHTSCMTAVCMYQLSALLHSSCVTAVGMYQLSVLCCTAAVWLQSVCNNLVYTAAVWLQSVCTNLVHCDTAAVWLQSVCTNLVYCVKQQLYDCSPYVPTYCTVLHSSCMTVVGIYQIIVLCYTTAVRLQSVCNNLVYKAAVWLQSACTKLLYCVTQQLYDCSRYEPT